MDAATRSEEDFPSAYTYCNYCVGFIDLLGQRNALRNQNLLPIITSELDRTRIHEVFENSIGAIYRLQDKARTMMDILQHLRNRPSEDSNEIKYARLDMQKWSDGLLFFSCLGDSGLKCDTNGVVDIFIIVGVLCMFGLAEQQPIRGAIEIAWAVELNSGELYGAAVARAYELESEVAQYPRIIVGPETIKFLQARASDQEQNTYSEQDRRSARACLEMLRQDVDGHYFLHYLGDSFLAANDGLSSIANDLYAKAHQFISEQLNEHQKNKNTKLAFRYLHLLHYFNLHPPKKM